MGIFLEPFVRNAYLAATLAAVCAGQCRAPIIAACSIQSRYRRQTRRYANGVTWSSIR